MLRWSSHWIFLILLIIDHIIPLLKETKSFSCIWIEVRCALFAVHRKEVYIVLVLYRAVFIYICNILKLIRWCFNKVFLLSLLPPPAASAPTTAASVAGSSNKGSKSAAHRRPANAGDQAATAGDQVLTGGSGASASVGDKFASAGVGGPVYNAIHVGRTRLLRLEDGIERRYLKPPLGKACTQSSHLVRLPTWRYTQVATW